MNDDLISRQAAIDALEREQSLVERPITETRWFDLGLRKAQEVLSELPSAVNHGRWVEKTVNNCRIDEWQSARCSVCGRYHTTPYMYYFTGFKYCPNCGAVMEER